MVGELDLLSRFSFEETVSNLKSSLKKRQLTEFAVFDHRKNAEMAGLEMNDCTVFVFGNPAIGTYMMQEDPTIGLDLPSRILVYVKDGSTHVRFRHIDADLKTERSKDALNRLNSVVEAIARECAGIQP
ncbi:DUF302 domain-containing protein [Thermoplasma sp.]|uniref:DUF302 domain-containing protein n=1 Tax=Thermoplasma sp. TaxID=1973142 RepID=UPI001277DD65|nr:DUF302 domain-containing protein [Thermoplasma sp.]KAA8921986.1 MAG: DUF302 domain-containing protein [Thermoplasma sp.]